MCSRSMGCIPERLPKLRRKQGYPNLIYHFFSSKELLFIAALEKSIDCIVNEIRGVAAPPELLFEEIRAAYAGISKIYRKEIILHVQAYGVNDEEIRKAMRNGFERIRSVILAHLEDASIEDVEVELASIMAHEHL